MNLHLKFTSFCNIIHFELFYMKYICFTYVWTRGLIWVQTTTSWGDGCIQICLQSGHSHQYVGHALPGEYVWWGILDDNAAIPPIFQVFFQSVLKFWVQWHSVPEEETIVFLNYPLFFTSFQNFHLQAQFNSILFI